MRGCVQAISAAMAMALTACGSGPDRDVAVRDVAPNEFALIPCGAGVGDRPCALVIVGGKRLLFGAPSGVATGLRAEDLKQLDAVLLFSLRARDTEGLDDIRNQSWEAGRDAPLLVIGPDGVESFVESLNKAYEMADALRVVEDGIPSGGFDAAILRAHTGRQQTVFNTGDVMVWRSRPGYSIVYLEQNSVWLGSCQADAIPEADVSIWCDPERGEYAWPLEQPIFVELFGGPE